MLANGMPLLDEPAQFHVGATVLICMAMLGVAGLVQLVWNRLQRERPGRQLAYWQVLPASIVLGVAAVGLFVATGVAPDLTAPDAFTTARRVPLDLRRLRLEQLRAALAAWRHDHRAFPQQSSYVGPEQLWHAPDDYGSRYVYRPPRDGDPADVLLVVEPGIFGEVQLGLRADGTIAPVSREDVHAWLSR